MRWLLLCGAADLGKDAMVTDITFYSNAQQGIHIVVMYCVQLINA